MSTRTAINRQGRCVFWFERERTPKPCARTLQGSRKARKTDVSEDDEDDEESGTARKSKYEVKEAKLTVNPDQKQFTEAEVSELTRRAAAIRIGYAYMDLVQPPLDTRYQFGRWNNREPADGKVGNLVKSFQTAIHPWYDPIAVILPRAWVDPTSVQKEPIQGLEGPQVRLTEAARGGQIALAGGKHRTKAIRIYLKEVQADLAKAHERLEKAHKRKKDDDRKAAEIEQCHKDIERLQGLLKQPTAWACAYYPAGERHFRHQRRIVNARASSRGRA